MTDAHTEPGNTEPDEAEHASVEPADTEAAPAGAVRRFREGPHLPALVVTLIVTVVAGLFAGTYSWAMGDPQPHDIPLGMVSSTYTPAQLEAELEARTGTTFVVSAYDTEGDAERAISEQEVYGAVVEQADQTVRLYVSSASGASVARLLQSDALRLEQTLGRPITVIDTHPLGPKDPNGLVLFYVALAAVIIGFVGAIQTRVNAARLTLGGELFWDVVRSVLGGFAIAFTVGPLLGVLLIPFFPVWGVLALTMLIAGATYSFWRVLLGARWAMLPTWFIFVLISNPSSGGAVAPELLPPFYEFMGRWLPTGATVRAVRDLTYFPGDLHAEPYIVLAVWLVAALGLFVAVRLLRYGPGAPGEDLHEWRGWPRSARTEIRGDTPGAVA
ncbi:ABC transporter permease [Leifsonia sp. F6_8S_P_1B]|uniref:ABC transporter permease n=1 Tax=Leifsonia williamsii TaxID=3035919 RepID=A0ABT8K8Y2_9MICO|nr:ABC transporter permease [Leifsonia williamsii]MDN4613926.1 ABC transporter permease [Leifsonia williamsii]